MTVVSHRLRLAYEPIPKNACTTVKSMLFHADTGRIYSPETQGNGYIEIHWLYPSMTDGGLKADWLAHYDRIVVLRDPVARFVSGYRNRIAHHQDIRVHAERDAAVAARLAELALPVVPDINVFARNLATYMKVSGLVWHHFLPQYDFMKHVETNITHVFGMDQLEALRDLLSRKAGIDVALPRLQTAGPEMSVGELERANLDIVEAFYIEDYRLLQRCGLDVEAG